MSEFDRPLPSFRVVESHHGDDLQAIAQRELGDANRWIELVWLNNLRPPYLTANERLVEPGVLLAGALLKVPAPSRTFSEPAETGQVYERDCRLHKRRLTFEGGDLAVVSGIDNLRQQLAHRISTPRGQMRRHPSYGCLVWRLVGQATGPLLARLGAEYVKGALRADYRVASVPTARAQVVGDAVRITASAEAIAGGSVDLITQR